MPKLNLAEPGLADLLEPDDASEERGSHIRELAPERAHAGQGDATPDTWDDVATLVYQPESAPPAAVKLTRPEPRVVSASGRHTSQAPAPSTAAESAALDAALFWLSTLR